MMQALIHRYTQLCDDAREQLGKGHVDTVAYGNIVIALAESDPKQALLVKIAAARDAIVQNDQRNWNRREGYRGYYRREIALFEQALQDLDRAKGVADEATGCES